MPFNSFGFIFLFLPAALGLFYGFVWLGWQRRVPALLVLCSLVFYAIAVPPQATVLLLASIAANCFAGVLIERYSGTQRGGRILALAISANLAVLGYFKYSGFFIDSFDTLRGARNEATAVFLPLAITFYTFQHIAYLLDVRRGLVTAVGLVRYAVFALFFPRLIAGPIVHYNKFMPDLAACKLGRFASANLLVGLGVFAIGLFKKTLIAAIAGSYAAPMFDQAAAGEHIGIVQAWFAALTYTIQLYFDFSGYSDMAIGLARMFGVRLPANFHSPLRATSIIDYWRRWHITLQRFIMAYIYQPLALPLARFASDHRLGKQASFQLTVVLPTVFLFIFVGFWHGAGWTFILFGALHGLYVSINEYWQQRQRKVRRQKGVPGPLAMAGYRLLTLAAILFANVLFRSATVADAATIWRSMFDLGSLGGLATMAPTSLAEAVHTPLIFTLLSFALIFSMPNTQQFFSRYRSVRDWAVWRSVSPPALSLTWRPTPIGVLAITLVLFFGVSFIARDQAEFIYFNF